MGHHCWILNRPHADSYKFFITLPMVTRLYSEPNPENASLGIKVTWNFLMELQQWYQEKYDNSYHVQALLEVINVSLWLPVTSTRLSHCGYQYRGRSYNIKTEVKKLIFPSGRSLYLVIMKAEVSCTKFCVSGFLELLSFGQVFQNNFNGHHSTNMQENLWEKKVRAQDQPLKTSFVIK